MSEIERGLTTLSRWFDEDQRDGADSEGNHWHRIVKVTEEAGEVTEAMIGWTARNPRKGQSHSQEDVEKELLDTAMAALGAIEHLHGNPDRAVSLRLLETHVRGLVKRAGLTLVPITPLLCERCGDEVAYCGGPRAHLDLKVD
jgi:NTP pyrophosphatase (non-canonical NTP hydrolase)